VTYRFTTTDAALVQSWIGKIQRLLEKIPERPKNLWVFINPYGGSRRALGIWKHKVLPLFELTGIVSEVHVTKKANEALETVRTADASKLEAFDGIVVVGGDGLFQEVTNGLLERSVESKQIIRVGHIPAGSTDAVAWSVSGTRCPVTAALHIILGDRMSLDVMRVQSDSGKHHRYSVCIAGYGFMGDIITRSERLRWFGPARYDIAGIVTFLAHNSHKARVSFVRARKPKTAPSECKAACFWCQGQKNQDPSAESRKDIPQDVEVVEGEFVSIMIAVMPCRSDKSPNGVVPHAHLSDGRLHLILVKKCPRWRYLAFLVSLAKRGIVPGAHSFVEIIDCNWAHVEPVNATSVWSIDGETLKEQNIVASVHHVSVDVFARGIE